jgi:AmiR/NasT family two-component response regulator
MAIEILRDLRGLRVEVMHQPDAERVSLGEHLTRIGCVPTNVWPVPGQLTTGSDLVIVSIEHDTRDELRRLFVDRHEPRATVIGIVGYENPSTLQLVLEIGAHAVIERPIRPFGLLTQLVIARSLWLIQHEAARRSQRLERKLSGLQVIHRARLILMTNNKLSEKEAYETIRRQAMARRMPIEDIAASIIDRDGSQTCFSIG